MQGRRDIAAVLALTFVSGCVDAVSFLGLGEVFLANMTGNLAIVGFAVASDDTGQGLRAATSLACFTLGAFVGGRTSRPLPAGVPWAGSVDRLLVVQLLLLLGATGLLATTAGEPDQVRYGVIALVSAAMGLQGAAARRVGVADVPTTVITSTLTGLVVDSPSVGGGRRWRRRLGALLALLLGAALGALLVTWLPLWTGAALAAVVVAGVLVAGVRRTRGLGGPVLRGPVRPQGE